MLPILGVAVAIAAILGIGIFMLVKKNKISKSFVNNNNQIAKSEKFEKDSTNLQGQDKNLKLLDIKEKNKTSEPIK